MKSNLNEYDCLFGYYLYRDTAEEIAKRIRSSPNKQEEKPILDHLPEYIIDDQGEIQETASFNGFTSGDLQHQHYLFDHVPVNVMLDEEIPNYGIPSFFEGKELKAIFDKVDPLYIEKLELSTNMLVTHYIVVHLRYWLYATMDGSEADSDHEIRGYLNKDMYLIEGSL